MPTQRTGTGFVSLGQYLDANRGTLDNEAKTLGDAAASAADKAKTDANAVGQAAVAAGAGGQNDPTQVNGYANAQHELADAQTGLSQLDTFGGTANALASQYGKGGGYGQGAAGFDSSLLGGYGPAQQAFKTAQGKYSDLGGYLDAQANAGLKQGQAQAAQAAAQQTPPAQKLPPIRQPGGGFDGDTDTRGKPQRSLDDYLDGQISQGTTPQPMTQRRPRGGTVNDQYGNFGSF